ncbi:hypothetical protein ACGFZR_28905 [Streptomyces sp. NPDC048241]|uniref:hypothetical protein n=1 Tax=Streptomyces sp. NPDC048241 TaxID=3365521 RepID=UPI0037128EF6
MSAPAHQLIVSPFLGEYLVLRPGDDNGVQIPLKRYLELSSGASAGIEAPYWLVDSVRQAWGLDLPAHRPLRDSVLVRAPSPYGMARASYEINKGCDYDCPHCYGPTRSGSSTSCEMPVCSGSRSRAASH